MKKIRALTLFTLFCFVVNHASFAVPGGGLTVLPQRESPGFLQIEIPENLASVEEIYQAPATPDPQLILYIQNAHGSYEAQMKIKQLLDYLYQTYGFKLIFVEGAAETLKPEYLRLFPDAENNKRLADYLTKQGELTGAEFYLIDGPGDVEAVGIEKAEVYRTNYEAFKEVYRAKADGDAFMDGFERKMQTLSSKLFSSEARRLLSEWKKFESGHRDFLPYVKQLAQESKKVLGVDLESLFSQVEWPQVTRLLVLQSMEKDMNRVDAEKERTKLIRFLEEKGVSPAILKDVKELGEKRISMNRLSDSGKGTEESQPRYLMERLVEEAGPKGFYFHDYPAFSLYAGYLILQSELESRKLFEEIELLFKKILDELTPSEIEKNLLELYRDEELLRKLFHLELTRNEWGRVYYRREWIEPKAMNRRLVAVREDMENDRHFRADKKESGIRGLTEEEKLSDDKMAVLSGMFSSAFQFYDVARQREAVFRDVIRKEMAARKTNKAVLITGGFHTEGVSDLLRQEQVNYGVLMPKITQAIDNVNYLTAMMEDRRTMFDLSNLETVLRIQSAVESGAQGADLAEKVKVILAAYAGVASFADMEQMKGALDFMNQQSFGKAYQLTFKLSEDEKFVAVNINGQAYAHIPVAVESGAVRFQSHAEDIHPDVLAALSTLVPLPAKTEGVLPPANKPAAPVITMPAGTSGDAATPSLQFVPVDVREQFAGVLLGPSLSAAIDRMDPAAKTRSVAVMGVTRGIASQGAGIIDVLTPVAKAVSRAADTSGYAQIRDQLARLSPAFADETAAGVLGVEIGRGWSLAEVTSFVEGLAAIQVLQVNQAISVFIQKTGAKPEVLAELPKLEARIKELKDAKGKKIDGRFSITSLLPNVSGQQIQKDLQGKAGLIRGRVKGSSVRRLQDDTVLLVQRESRLQALIDKRVVSLSSPVDLLRKLESLVGVRFSTIGRYEELDPETQRALEREGMQFRMVQSALEQMGVEAELVTLLEATFKIASSA